MNADMEMPPMLNWALVIRVDPQDLQVAVSDSEVLLQDLGPVGAP